MLRFVRQNSNKNRSLPWSHCFSDKDFRAADDAESKSFDSQVESYKKRLQERKKIRGVLNNCGLNQDWLANKSGRTELESRVLKRMILKGRPEITIKEVIRSATLETWLFGHGRTLVHPIVQFIGSPDNTEKHKYFLDITRYWINHQINKY